MERRVIYGVPECAPRIVQLTRSRMAETPASEFDIPHYCLWDDGSEYEVFYTPHTSNRAVRRYHGPVFLVPRGKWKTVEFDA